MENYVIDVVESKVVYLEFKIRFCFLELNMEYKNKNMSLYSLKEYIFNFFSF